MAEMTAQEAIELLKNRTPAWLGPAMFYITESESQQIAALIEQQQQKIEQQAAKIAKKDRMLDKIYKPLQNCDCKGEKTKCDVLDKGLYPWDLCEYYWLCEIAWLEKEAQGVE